MKYTHFIFLLSTSILFSCQESAESDYYESISMDNYELIAIDTVYIHYTDSLLLGEPALFTKWNSYIFISDAQFTRVWVFDENFRFVTKIGSRGSGPGEYTDLPIPLFRDDHFCLIEYNSKRAHCYNSDFQLVSGNLLPGELYFLRILPISIDRDKNIFSAIYAGRYPASDSRYYHAYNSLFILDDSLNLSGSVLEWDDIYFNEDYKAFTISNNLVNLTKSAENSFFAQQRASYIIHHIDKNLEVIRSFGSKPDKYRLPESGVSISETQRSMEAFLEFHDGTIQFRQLDYDEETGRLHTPYTIINKDAILQRNPYLSNHYLQIYDDQYNCIYDGPIPGIYALSLNGKMYIRTAETPGYLELTVYKLSER